MHPAIAVLLVIAGLLAAVALVATFCAPSLEDMDVERL